jgi:hypothetical protein
VLAEGRPERDHGLRVASSHPVRVAGKALPDGKGTTRIRLTGRDPARFVRKTVVLRQD